MTDLKPHPLVEALARELLTTAQVAAQQGNPLTGPEVATSLARDATVPELLTFAGFFGGVIEDSAKDKWVVFYFDAKLLTWLVVQETGIVHRSHMDDKTAPGGKRDVIWVKRDAFVTKGTTPPSPEQRFLQGDLVRADDFHASLTAPTLSSATGVFCEADTIGCCKKATW
jgi:hypothetical protein